jgi:hypothetical protein
VFSSRLSMAPSHELFGLRQKRLRAQASSRLLRVLPRSTPFIHPNTKEIVGVRLFLCFSILISFEDSKAYATSA